jgi:hypothetical protein
MSSTDREDSLTALFALRPRQFSRNRNFTLHDSGLGERARKRARRLVIFATQFHKGSMANLTCENARDVDDQFLVSYDLPSLHLARKVVFSATDLRILRLRLRELSVVHLPDWLAITALDAHYFWQWCRESTDHAMARRASGNSAEITG